MHVPWTVGGAVLSPVQAVQVKVGHETSEEAAANPAVLLPSWDFRCPDACASSLCRSFPFFFPYSSLGSQVRRELSIREKTYDPHTIRGTPCYGEPLTCQSARWGLWHLACYSRKAFHHHCPACPDDQERVRSHRTRVPHHDCCGCGVDPCSLHRGVLALYFPCAPGV